MEIKVRKHGENELCKIGVMGLLSNNLIKILTYNNLDIIFLYA